MSLSPAKPLRVLVLDGGGIKGLTSLLILQRIFRTIKDDAALLEEPRPYDIFDLIVGTSTGGLIAVMLGRLGMKIDEAIAQYQTVGLRVFGKAPVGGIAGFTIKGLFGSASYDIGTLQASIKNILDSRSPPIPADTLFCERSDPQCKVMLCVTRQITAKPDVIRSYKSKQPTQENYDCSIWEAGSATSAAPIYFKEVKFAKQGEKWVDGGMRRNNPIFEAIAELRNEPTFKGRDIGCVVSIGTGVPVVKGVPSHLLGLLDKAVSMMTDSEQIADDFAKGEAGQRLTNLNAYFRFNVPQGMEHLKLDDWKETERMRALTNDYLSKVENGGKVQRCAASLLSPDQNTHLVMSRESSLLRPYPTQPVRQGGLQFIVPYASNTDFVGRSSIMEKLKEMLSPSHHRKNITYHMRVALHGLGGIGKTQIAIEYAYRAHEIFPKMSIFWVHASNPERFLQSILRIAEECKIPGHDDPKADKGALVKNWFEGHDCPLWLLILDNADDHEMFFGPQKAEANRPHSTTSVTDGQLGKYIPECSHGSIIITTRNKQAAVKLTRNRGLIEVEKMNPTEAAQLVMKKLEDDALDCNQVAILSSRLESLPLALAQAAAYIREYTIPVEKYLQLLDCGEDNFTELLSERFQEAGRDSEIPNAVIETWILSFNQIQKQCPFASEMLSLMSYFDRQRIPKAFLRYQQNKVRTVLEQEKAIGVLKAFSFVNAGTEGETLNIHRLVQLATQRWLIMERGEEAWAEKALLILSDLYPYGSHENREVCNEYLPHAYAVLAHKLPYSANTIVARASLLHCLSGLMCRQGLWKKAEKLLVEAAELRRKELGAEDPDTLTSMANLASTYRNQGRWKEAEELEVQVKDTSLRVLGAEHPNTLTSMANLASTFWSQGRWKEAEELDVQVKDTSLRVLGAEHPNILTSMANLASTYRNQGRWKEAEELEVQVKDTRKRVLGAEHPDTLTSMANLASTYRNQGRWEEAEELQAQELKICSRVLGEEHPDTLTSMENLALIWRGNGRDIEALQLLQKCIQLRKQILGDDHPYTISSSKILIEWQTENLDI